MLPDVKQIVEKLFATGLIKILFATETFAVGINMPAKTVCFDGLRKFTKTGFRYLTSKEYFQISGRAGRRGIDKKGLSVAVIHRPGAELDKIAEFTEKDVLPLKSQFQLTINTVLNLVNRHSEEEIEKILKMNLYTYQKTNGRLEGRVLGSIKARFTKVMKQLEGLKYIENGKLTKLGRFASKIFSEELEISQLFCTKTVEWDEYLILLIIVSIVYEGKRDAKFGKLFDLRKANELTRALQRNEILRRGKWMMNINNMNALVYPLFNQKKFIELLDNTNLPEGDLIRLLMRVIDKLEQIDRAIEEDEVLLNQVRNCKHIIKSCLEGIHVF
jgi:superfamily II RNA helicase